MRCKRLEESEKQDFHVKRLPCKKKDAEKNAKDEERRRPLRRGGT